MILFLPPAPHTGAFFDTVRKGLSGIETQAATYPGYGDRPSAEVSIKAYAESLLPVNKDIVLAGFHTGCLVALEMAHQQNDIENLILVDIPYFDETAKTEYARGLNPDDPAHNAFQAAFTYDLDTALGRCQQKVTVIATRSPLFEPTSRAARILAQSVFIAREDIEKPAFESEALVALFREHVTGPTTG